MDEGREGAAWEDALDLDDSDLPSLLPPLRPCSFASSQPLSSSSPAAEQGPAAPPRPPRRIPGPAGTVQATMHWQATAAKDCGSFLLEGGAAEEEDEDFLQDPWLRALEFVATENGSGGASALHTISSVKSVESAGRVPKLMGVVKSCKSNGLGDLFVTLKDHTGTIDASVHRKVLLEGNLGGDLSVGCVLILKQVAVFSPRRSIVYLNITRDNVDKGIQLFGKDIGSPHKPISTTLTTADHPPSGKRSTDEMDTVGGSYLPSKHSQRSPGSRRCQPTATRPAGRGSVERRGSVQAWATEIGKSICSKRSADDMQMEHLGGSVEFGDVDRGSLDSQFGDGMDNGEAFQHIGSKGRINQGEERMKGTAMASPSSLGWVTSQHQEADQAAAQRTVTSSNMEAGDVEGGGPAGDLSPPFRTGSASPSKHIMLCKPSESVAESRSLISKVPLAKWTDEQLSELFCDYQDDAGFF